MKADSDSIPSWYLPSIRNCLKLVKGNSLVSLVAKKEMRKAEYPARSTTAVKYDVRNTTRHDSIRGVTLRPEVREQEVQHVNGLLGCGVFWSGLYLWSLLRNIWFFYSKGGGSMCFGHVWQSLTTLFVSYPILVFTNMKQ